MFLNESERHRQRQRRNTETAMTKKKLDYFHNEMKNENASYYELGNLVIRGKKLIVICTCWAAFYSIVIAVFICSVKKMIFFPFIYNTWLWIVFVYHGIVSHRIISHSDSHDRHFSLCTALNIVVICSILCYIFSSTPFIWGWNPIFFYCLVTVRT